MQNIVLVNIHTACKVSKNAGFSGPQFSVFGLNTGKYEPEKTPYLDTFPSVTTNPSTP